MASESIELQEQFARFQFHSMSTAKTFYVKQSEDETVGDKISIITLFIFFIIFCLGKGDA